ncbi:MAG: hypothetical protein KKD65_10825 [Gammaproteobacteria bacterium]|nr:hypothetical protein [Gammaproteobacteria bacterium]
MAAKDDWSGKQDTTSMSVRVRDILVAQLGDSFASGNGVPEWRAQSLIEQVSGIESARVGLAKSLASALLMGRHDQDVDVKTVWADVDGPWVPPPSAISKTIRIETLLDLEIAAGVLGRSIASECRSSPLNCGQALLQGALGVSNFNVTLKPDAKLPNYETMTKMHKQHYLSHRSSYAPGSLVALALEDASDKTSVTFVNLAMTGATVNLGLLGGNKGIKTERFYDDNFMDPQLDQLEKIANGRSIDALLLSIGGNDAGFKNVLTGLVARERGEGELDLIGPTYAQLEAGVHGGHWDAIENQIPDILSLLKSTFEWGELAGLDSLPGLYVQTRQRMEALGLNVRRTYITEYPDMTRNGQGETCAQILNTIHSGYPPGGMEIKKEELEWLQSHVAVPLNNTVHEAEVTNSWKYVDGIYAGSRLHGLCAPRPYNPMEFNIHIRHVPIEVPAECRTALGMPPGGMIRPACDNTWDSGVCSPSPVRWYRDENEGAVIENRSLEDSIIMVHPNEYGQALVAEAVIRALCHDLQ